MRIKTFIAAYLLFLFIIFSCLGTVSVYLVSSQLNILKEKSISEYQTIAVSLAKDIAVFFNRGSDPTGAIDTLESGYSKYYERNNISIDLTDTSLSAQNDAPPSEIEISFINNERESLIHVTGALPVPYQFYRLDYHLDISENLIETQSVQRTLLIICGAFSIATAAALYLVLAKIFKPLDVVTRASKKIADGFYGQRLRVKGKNEISIMARGFNRMADEIEKQINLLKDEAAAKQRFVDNFAHEIRTPLTSIYGFAEYMLKTSLDEDEVIDSARFIIDEAEYMKKIADSLLEITALRQYAPAKCKISIPFIFDEVKQTMKKPFADKNNRLICEYDAEFLVGQSDLIKSLLLNLCANALKSCAPGSGVVYVEAKRQGRGTVLSVSDNGRGIPEDSLIKITEPFYRVDKARSREDGGVGLGLTLCRQIAEIHGAEMMIESSVGVGTTVAVTFTSS